jgi:hypothetical protein
MSEIVVRDLRERPVTVYDPDGNVVVETDNMLTIHDICIQIMENKLEGYTAKIADYKPLPIRTDGMIVGTGAHLIGEVNNEQMRKLMGF